jgi:hypothetical protein
MDWVASNEAVEVELHMELVSRCQRLTRMAHSVLHPLGLTMIFPFLPSLVSSFTIPEGEPLSGPSSIVFRGHASQKYLWHFRIAVPLSRSHGSHGPLIHLEAEFVRQ